MTSNHHTTPKRERESLFDAGVATPSPCRETRLFLESVSVPRQVVKKMASEGAQVDSCAGVVLVQCDVGDKACAVWCNWTRCLSDEASDPYIQTIVDATKSLAPLHLHGLIGMEAQKIVAEYAPFRMAHFFGGEPPIQGFVAEHPAAIQVKFHHAQVACSKLAERLANPTIGAIVGGSPYNGICSLPAGAYVCTLQQIFKGTVCQMCIYRE